MDSYVTFQIIYLRTSDTSEIKFPTLAMNRDIHHGGMGRFVLGRMRLMNLKPAMRLLVSIRIRFSMDYV